MDGGVQDRVWRKIAADRNRFFARAWKDCLSGLLTELQIPSGGDLTMVGDGFYRRCMDSWLKAGGVEPLLIEHGISRASEAVLWSLPACDAVFLFETLMLVRGRSLSIRKLARRLRPGAFVISANSVVPPRVVLDGELAAAGFVLDNGLVRRADGADCAPIDPAGWMREKTAAEFEEAGLEVLKHCVWYSSFFGVVRAFQKDCGANVFSCLEDGRVLLEVPDCIPADRVLEKVAFSLIIARRPAAATEAVVCEPLDSEGLRTIEGDRRAEYFLSSELEAVIPPHERARLEKCLTTSLRNLEPGRDFDSAQGRSLYLDLDEPMTIGRNRVLALKVKGATFNADERFDAFAAVPDSMLGFDRRGVFFRPNFDDKPMGSMTFGQARNEFDIMSLAMRRGIGTDSPLGLARYGGVRFQNRAAGSVIIGVEDAGGENLFFDVFSRILGTVSETEENLVISIDKKAVLKAAGVLVKYGQALRRMHRAGIIHVLGHNRQFSCIDGRIVFHDFEYSLSQSGMSRLQKAAYRLQDVRRSLFGLKIFHSKEKLGIDFGQCFCQGYFGARDKLAKRVDDMVIEAALFDFYDPRRAAENELINWMLAEISGA